jgi:hypothetical protein
MENQQKQTTFKRLTKRRDGWMIERMDDETDE